MNWYKKSKIEKSLQKEADAVQCPLCNSAMVKRKGQFGEFYGCSKYPNCKGNRPLNAAQPRGNQPVVNQPAARPQNPQPIRNEQIAQPAAKINNPWVLATLLSDGSPIVARKGEGAVWEYLTEDKASLGERELDAMGGLIEIPVTSLATTIKSVNGKDGKKVTGNDPKSLFKIFREINGIEEEKEEIAEPVKDERPKIKGRIPEDRISPHQKQIEVSFTGTDSNIMINALAGSGKTTVLKHISTFMKPGERWLYLVFNKKNQTESQGKFPAGVTVLTSHSFLGQVLGSNGEEYKTLPSTKYIFQDKNIANKKAKKIDLILDEVMGENGETGIPPNLRFAGSTIVKKVSALCKAYSVNPLIGNPIEKIVEIIKSYSINTKIVDPEKQGAGWGGEVLALPDYTEEIASTVLKVLKYSIPGMCNKPELNYVRDFDDTLWFPAINQNIVWPRYDVVLADEVQDFNECQSIMLRKLSDAGARVVAVGDPHQCHPAGTIISLSGGLSKPIEEIKIGDELVTYNSKKSFFPGVNKQGRKVLEVAKRSFSGSMISIKTKSYSHECTPNHRCVVRLSQKKAYGLYLMVKNNSARIGICRLKYFNGFGLTIRAVQEKADKAWLLNIYDNETDARASEAIYSAKFGIPQLIFFNKGQKYPTQEMIDKVYNGIGDNLVNAKLCLAHFEKEFEYPIWTKEEMEKYGSMKQNYIGSKKSFVTQACNLISDYMEVRTFDGTNRGGCWEECKISSRNTSCDVYSLSVEATEDGKRLYIANNIVTHNSIYRFRGSDSKSFEKVSQSIQAAPNGGLVHDLPTNYRSGKAIIEYVRNNTHVKDLQAGLNFEGEVSEGAKKEEVIDSIIKEFTENGKLKMSTAIIARTNSPLASTAVDLMKNNVEFVIIGKDFSKELTDFVYKTTKKAKKNRFDSNYLSNLSIQRLFPVMNDFVMEYEEMFGDKPSKVEEINENESMIDLIEQVILFLERSGFQDKKTNTRVNNSYQFIEYLKNKFGINEEEEDVYAGKDPSSFVTLTSAHKSKGLEFDRVLIIEPDLFPHPMAKSAEDRAQEENAKYVAFTRAMKELHVLAPSDKNKGKEGGLRNRRRGRVRRASSSKLSKKAGWYAKIKKLKIATISPENMQNLKQMGYKKLDELFIGPYELYIIGHSQSSMIQLALQTRNTQAFNVSDQNSKFEIEPDTDASYLDVMKNKILEWKSKYGALSMSSHNARKNEKYKNILTYMGFSPKETTMFGQKLYLI